MKFPKAMLLLLAATPHGVYAADWKPLSGTYAVTAEHYLDPSPEEPTNSHFRLQLTGSAAKDLYLAIPGNPSLDECTGAQAKSSGELECLYFKDGAKYECAFSLDLIEHKVEYGVAC
jgi:hypothetical protein